MNGPEPGWELYRTFLAVVREGSLSGAARALGLTQPTAGRHVDALERTLGLSLFIRTQQGLSPTEAALSLRPFAESLEATSAALLRAASSHGQGVRGTVRITASDVVAVEVLPPILAELHAAYPDLTLELAGLGRLGGRKCLCQPALVGGHHRRMPALYGAPAVGLHGVDQLIFRHPLLPQKLVLDAEEIVRVGPAQLGKDRAAGQLQQIDRAFEVEPCQIVQLALPEIAVPCGKKVAEQVVAIVFVHQSTTQFI